MRNQVGTFAVAIAAIFFTTTACGTEAAPPAQNIKIEAPAATPGVGTNMDGSERMDARMNDARNNGAGSTPKAPPDWRS